MRPIPGVVSIFRNAAVVLDEIGQERTIKLEYTRFGNFTSWTKRKLLDTDFTRHFCDGEQCPKSLVECLLRIIRNRAKCSQYLRDVY